MRFILILVLLYVEAAHALPPSMWTEEQAKTICALDVRRLYGDTLAVVSFMGKQPHEDNTTLVGLVASDSRTEYKRQQVVVGCIYKQDGSLITIFFNSKIANWTAPEKRQPAWAGGAYAPSTKRATAPAKRPPPPISQTKKTYTPAQLRRMVQSGNYPKQGTPSVETHNMNFVECIVRLEAIIDTIKPHYPTATVVNTRFMHVAKAWTNDGAVMVTCNAANNELVISTAPYL